MIDDKTYLIDCKAAVAALQQKGLPCKVAPEGVRDGSLGVIIRADAAMRFATMLNDLPDTPEGP